jgi:uncharacterized membrane protein
MEGSTRTDGTPHPQVRAQNIMLSRRWVKALWLVPIMMLATLVRLYGSTDAAVWCDEGSSLAMSEFSPSLIWFHSAHDVHPPLYFLLLHAWTSVFGTNLFSIRLLSVLPGVATVALGLWLTLLIAGRRAALLAGVFLALLPIAVRYSQEVRMYSLMGLGLLGATIALVYWVKNPQRHRYLVVYALLMTASFYTHYFTAFCVLSHWLYLLCLRKQPPCLILRPAWWITNCMIVVMFTPWLFGFFDLLQHLDQLRAGNDIGWITPVDAYSLPSTFWQFFTLTDGMSLQGWIYLSLPVALAGVVAAVWHQDHGPYKFHALLVIYALLPPIVVFLLSWITPLLVERYLMFSALGLPIILAIAIDRIADRFRTAAFFAVAVLLSLELTGLSNDYRTDAEQFDDLVNYVNEHYIADDRIVVSDMFWYLSYRYYNKTPTVPLLYTPDKPDGTSGRPNAYGFGTLFTDSSNVYLDRLQALGSGPARVWLISNKAPPDDFTSIPVSWVLVTTLTIEDTQLRLYAIPAATGPTKRTALPAPLSRSNSPG